MSLLFLPIFAVLMYALLIRPQQQRLKEQRALLAALDVGDDVVTESGLYGTVSELDGDTAFLLISDGVEVKVTKASIAGLVTYNDEVEDELVDEE